MALGLQNILEPKIMLKIDRESKMEMIRKQATYTRPRHNSFELDWDSSYAVCTFLQHQLAMKIQAGFKIGNMADKTGLGHGTIAKIAYGETKSPTGNTVIQLCKYLGFKVQIHHG